MKPMHILFFFLALFAIPDRPAKSDPCGQAPTPLASGQFLGNIVVPAGGSQNNKNTAVPFSIPRSIPYIAAVLDSESSGYSYRTGTGSSLAAASTDLNQVGPATLQIAINNASGVEQVVAFYNAGGGGTVKVYQMEGVNTSSTCGVGQ